MLREQKFDFRTILSYSEKTAYVTQQWDALLFILQVVGLQKVYKKYPPAVSLVLAVVAFFIYW